MSQAFDTTLPETSQPLALPRCHLDRRTFPDLMEDYKIVIEGKELANWRLVYPTNGELKGLNLSATILATNGVLAFYDLDCGQPEALFLGHLSNFLGVVSHHDPLHAEAIALYWEQHPKENRVKLNHGLLQYIGDFYLPSEEPYYSDRALSVNQPNKNNKSNKTKEDMIAFLSKLGI